MVSENTYNSIDNLIQIIKPEFDKSAFRGLDFYDYILSFHYGLVLDTLKSKTNAPSVHDLNLLKNSITMNSKYNQTVNVSKTNRFAEIIDYYKNRKVS